jgi:hypothetical protein
MVVCERKITFVLFFQIDQVLLKKTYFDQMIVAGGFAAINII